MAMDVSDPDPDFSESGSSRGRIISLAVLLVAILFLLIPVSDDVDAEVFEVDGVIFETKTSSTVLISGVASDKEDWNIPYSIGYDSKNYIIAGVKASAFKDSEKIIGELTITHSLSIESNSFYNCSKLTKISISNAILYENCFSNCLSLTNIDLNSGVRVVGDSFVNCKNVANITLCVTDYTNWIQFPFQHCNIAESVTLDIMDSVTELPVGFFKGLSSISFLNSYVGSGIIKHNYESYEGCELYIPNGILEISKSVTDIDCNFLDSIINLNDIYVSTDNTTYYSKDKALYHSKTGTLEYVIRSVSGEFVIDLGTNTIGQYAFNNCTDLTEITIPKSVTNINYSAFKNTTSLNCYNVDKYSSKYSQYDGVLYTRSCSMLVSYPSAKSSNRYSVSEYAISIAPYAFYNCKNVNEILLNTNITSIGEYAFYGCNFTSKIVILSSDFELGDRCLDLMGYEEDSLCCDLLTNKYIDYSPYYGTTPEAKIISKYPCYSLSYYDDVESKIPDYVEYYGNGDLVRINYVPHGPVGHSFEHWIIDSNHHYKLNESFLMESKNLVAIGKWRPNVYSVNYNSNGGSGEMEPVSYEYGVSKVLPTHNFEKEGHTFSHWNTTPDNSGVSYSPQYDGSLMTSIDGAEITLFAIWTVNKYELTLDYNDGSDVVCNSYNYGDLINIPSNPARIGHTFLGWNPNIPINMPATNITCVAEWSINSYDITLDYGYDGIKVIESIDYNASTGKIQTPERVGYSFVCWNPNIPDEMPANNLFVVATWLPNTYFIKFNSNGGNGYIESIDAIYDEFYQLPISGFNRIGYTFQGWSKSSIAIEEYNPGESVSNLATGADGQTTVMLYAIWSPNVYVVNFESNGGHGEMESMNMTYDVQRTLPACGFTRTGYTFQGWGESTSAMDMNSPGSAILNLVTGVAGDDSFTFYAIWAPVNYVVTFDPNGALGHMSPISVEYDSDDRLPAVGFQREGHTFSGWASAPDGSVIRDDGSIANNLSDGDTVELFAIWAVNEYEITFIDIGDSTISSIIQDFGSEITCPPNPTKVGHTFSHWYPSIPRTMPSSDMVIEAMWIVNEYDIDFENCNLDGISVRFGTQVSLDEPERYGYVFLGWSEDVPDLMPDRDLVFTAEWEAKVVRVGFDGFPDIHIDTRFDSPYGDLPDLVREGYDLRGWYEDKTLEVPVMSSTTVSNSDAHILYGRFVKVWNIRVMSDEPDMGEAVGSGTFDDEAEFTICASAFDGYGFVRWSDGSVESERTLVAGYDLQLSAVFAPLRNVSFISSDGVDPIVVVDTVGTSILAPESSATVEGYLFIGWSDGSQRYPCGSEVPVTDDDRTLYGVWDPIGYDFRLDFDDGLVTEYVLYVGDRVPEFTVPEKEGKSFAGWDSPIPEYMPAKDLSFKVIWVTDTVVFSFDTSGGSAIDDMVLAVATDVPEIPVPERYGYEFLGWDSAIPEKVPDQDRVFEAIWDVGEYTITFDSMKGSPISPITATYGASISMWDVPVRAGYSFSGWSPSIPDTMPGVDMTVEATWVHEIRSIILEKGDEDIVLHGYYGEKVDLPDGAAILTGHRFEGWMTDIPSRFPDMDIVIRGEWVPEAYSLTYDLDEDVVIDVRYGDRIPYDIFPTKEGYRFVGWSPSLTDMPAEDITLVPKWMPFTYILTFVLPDGSECAIDDVPVGSLLTYPQYDGVVGWLPGGFDSMPSHDVTFYPICVQTSEGGSRFSGDSMVIAADIGDIQSPTFCLERESFWSIVCDTSVLNGCDGHVYASVSLGDDLETYVVNMGVTEGHLFGDITIALPYLGHVGDRVDVRVIDDDGTHIRECISTEVDGTVYLMLDSTTQSLCQIIGVTQDGGHDPWPLPFTIPVTITILVAGFILWRRMH